MEGWELDGGIYPVARRYMGLQQLEDSGCLASALPLFWICWFLFLFCIGHAITLHLNIACKCISMIQAHGFTTHQHAPDGHVT